MGEVQVGVEFGSNSVSSRRRAVTDTRFAHFRHVGELWLEGVVGPLRTDAFVFAGELPRGANPDVAMFVTDKRPIPVAAAALGEPRKVALLWMCQVAT